MNTLNFFNFSKKIHTQIKIILMSLVFMTLPLANNINSISIILLSIYSLIFIKRIKFKKIKQFKYMILYFVIVCTSLLYTKNLDIGFKYIVKFLPFLIFPIIFSILKFNRAELVKIFNLFAIWMCCLIFYAEVATIYEILKSNESLYLIFRKDYSYIVIANKIGMHPPYFALYISFCIFYLITHFNKNNIPRLVKILMLVLMLFFLVHLSSRLPLVAAFITGFGIYIYVLKKKFGAFKTIAFSILPIILVAFFILNVRSTAYRFQELIGMQYSSGLYIESGPSKLKQWEAGLLANKHIVFGEGIGDANEKIIESNYENELFKNAKREYNAHNQFIQTYVGLGLAGLILLGFIIIFYGFISPKKDFRLLFYGFSIYLLIVFLSESYLERHHGIVFISLILSLTNSKNQYLGISKSKISFT